MPETSYKPLFNRRYLFILMWLIPIVILLLHSAGGEKQLKALDIRWVDDPPHWRLSHAQIADYRLTLTAQVPVGWSLEGQRFNAAVEQTIQDWLQQPGTQTQLAILDATAHLQRRSTTFRLDFNMKEQPSASQMTWFLSAIEQLSLSPYADEQRLMATWQVDQGIAENRLLAEFETWLLHKLSDKPRLEWTLQISGADLSEVEGGSLPVTLTQHDLGTTTHKALQGFVAHPSHLLGWSNTRLDTPEAFALNRLAIATLHKGLEQLDSSPQYRFIWNPLPPYSHRVLIIHEQETQALFMQLLEILEGPMAPTLIASARKEAHQHASRWQQSADHAREWLEMSAALNFPKGSDLVYAEQLEQLSDQQIVAHLHQLLIEPPHFTIQLTPF